MIKSKQTKKKRKMKKKEKYLVLVLVLLAAYYFWKKRKEEQKKQEQLQNNERGLGNMTFRNTTEWIITIEKIRLRSFLCSDNGNIWIAPGQSHTESIGLCCIEGIDVLVHSEPTKTRFSYEVENKNVFTDWCGPQNRTFRIFQAGANYGGHYSIAPE